MIKYDVNDAKYDARMEYKFSWSRMSSDKVVWIVHRDDRANELWINHRSEMCTKLREMCLRIRRPSLPKHSQTDEVTGTSR